jgi:hypothetical protein
MSKEKRDSSESSSEEGPDQAGAVKIKLGDTAAGLLEFFHPACFQNLDVHEIASSVAVAGTAGSLHHRQAFQRSGSDAGVKAFSPANVRLASVDRGHDFPYPSVAGKSYKVIRLNFRALGCGPLPTKRRPPES